MLHIGLLTRESGEPANAYRVAGRPLLSDVAVPELFSFATALPVATRTPGVRAPERQGESWTTTFDEAAPLAGRSRRVLCRHGDGDQLTVEGGGAFRVSATGEEVRWEEIPGEPIEPAAVTEALLGPALSLALARQGVFCLHASAVEHDGRLIAFAGDSGAGKSTLARLLPDSDGGFRRVADDVLPLTLRDGAVVALPHFPQLKLPTDRQPGARHPESMPLAAIVVLGEPETGLSTVALRPLSGAAATLALVRHTVAGRLFDRDLLTTHLAFAGRLTATPVWRLHYPRRFDLVPLIGRQLHHTLAPAPADQPGSRLVGRLLSTADQQAALHTVPSTEWRDQAPLRRAQ